jgi:cytochrome P450
MGASLLKGFERNQLSELELAWFLGSILCVLLIILRLFTQPFLSFAGAETTTTALTWWTLAMVAHPEVQKRAQAELDAVVGRSRIPTFSDAPSLPYIQALLKETLRWRSPAPLGIPHRTTEDDWYDGMYIPKGTTCFVNHWQCDRDPVLYGEDAARFNPERFLDEHGQIIVRDPTKTQTQDDGHSAYGFGKRACVGKYLANDSLFIVMATVLWAANLERVRDDQSGEEVPVDTESFLDTGLLL